MSLEYLNAAFADGCDELAEGIAVVDAPGCGRGLNAARFVRPHEQVLIAPVALSIRSPVARPSEEEEEEIAPELIATYVEVSRICKEASSTFGCCFYWSALATLSSSDSPALREPGKGASGAWALPPPVPEELQDRLLGLYRPVGISSKCPGRELDGSDTAALHLHRKFGLRCLPSKFEHLVQVFKYNAFGVLSMGGPPETSQGNDRQEVNLFYSPSFCNHSCAPNCYWYCDEEGRFALCAGSNGLIEGESLSISYLTIKDLEMTTLERREQLALGWHFYCMCERCLADKVPFCDVCSEHCSVVISGQDESPYRGFDVDCDNCGQKDVALEHSYFFHCFECGTHDVCPSCAAV